jgi:transcriptional regulator with XRE-family HTH domain
MDTTAKPLRLLERRRALRQTQQRVADEAGGGLDRKNLSYIKRGLWTPQLPTLVRIARALEMDDLAEALEPFIVERDLTP